MMTPAKTELAGWAITLVLLIAILVWVGEAALAWIE